MSKTYRFGIVGTGAIAGFHAAALRDIANAELVAACDMVKERADAFAAKQGCAGFADLGEMFDRARPDVICVTTPSGAHLEPALAAAERGVHVICEKPLDISIERVDRMIAAFARGGAKLGAIFQQRMSPLMRAVREGLAEGRFGEAPTIACYVPWWRDDAYYGPGRWQGTLAMDGGGALMNQSVHGVDLVQWFAGARIPDRSVNPIEEVTAYTARTAHAPELMEVEDTAVVCLRFRGGGLGQLLAATSMYPGTLRRFLVSGRDATVEILEDQILTWTFREERPSDVEIRERFGRKTAHGGGAADPLAIDYVNHRSNIQAFLRALDGEAPLELDGAEARKAVSIVIAAYESARTGKPVRP